MRTTISTSLTLVAMLFAGPTLGADCERGQALYQQGLAAGKAGNMAQAVSYLEDSLTACESFESAYLLGQARQSLGQQAAAQAAFEAAQQYAANDDAIALALGRYAETRRDQGDLVEALSVAQEATALHSNPPAWLNTLAINLDEQMADQPLQVAQVTRALTLPKRAFHVTPLNSGGSGGGSAGGSGGSAAPAQNPYANNPSVNVRLNFEFNSTTLDSASQMNLSVLADALSQPSFAGKRFVLIGHSDVRGDYAYNQNLSEQRARAVSSALLQRKPELRGRVVTEGAGESRPLYRGNSEREHRLNRRLEVVVQ